MLQVFLLLRSSDAFKCLHRILAMWFNSHPIERTRQTSCRFHLRCTFLTQYRVMDRFSYCSHIIITTILLKWYYSTHKTLRKVVLLHQIHFISFLLSFVCYIFLFSYLLYFDFNPTPTILDNLIAFITL